MNYAVKSAVKCLYVCTCMYVCNTCRLNGAIAHSWECGRVLEYLLNFASSSQSSQYNYNRANGVVVLQPTPKMADVTVTKIADYVRVCVLMNR